ncbi:MAG TPA: hypothetical protein VJ787_09545 [Thermoleophilia bacterium]|nr:hypothetical protein [Thermoleophilia bacterium]
MTDSNGIGYEEWLAELLSETERSDDGLTLAELRERLGYGDQKVRGLLRRAKQRGMLRVGQRFVESLNNSRVAVPVYKITAPRGHAPS